MGSELDTYRALLASYDDFRTNLMYKDCILFMSDAIKWLDQRTRGLFELEFIPVAPIQFCPKIGNEISSACLLAPEVFLWPTSDELSPSFFVDKICNVPLFVLGIPKDWSRPIYADGLWLTPSEFFFHDVDHMRYQIRGGLLGAGVEIDDPYAVDARTGTWSTFDGVLGRHRTCLDLAVSALKSYSPPSCKPHTRDKLGILPVSRPAENHLRNPARLCSAALTSPARGSSGVQRRPGPAPQPRPRRPAAPVVPPARRRPRARRRRRQRGGAGGGGGRGAL